MVKNLFLIFPILLFCSCASSPNYQMLMNNYSAQINDAVQNGRLDYAEGERLKMQYLDQLNSAQNDQYLRNQARADSLRHLGNSFQPRPRSNTSVNCDSQRIGDTIYTNCH